MDLLEDADAGGDAERQSGAGERHLDVDGVEMAAVENGDVAVAVAEAAQPYGELHDLQRLGV